MSLQLTTAAKNGAAVVGDMSEGFTNKSKASSKVFVWKTSEELLSLDLSEESCVKKWLSTTELDDSMV